MLGSKSTSQRLSSPRWPGGARIETAPKNTRPLNATSVNAVQLAGPNWATTNASVVMARSRVEVAATAEARLALAEQSMAMASEELERSMRLDLTLGTVVRPQSPTNTTINMDVYRGPEKWTVRLFVCCLFFF